MQVGKTVFFLHKVECLVAWFLVDRDEVAKELKSALSHIKLSSEGVYVQASTLGSLEALLEFLKTSKIPVSIEWGI